MEGWIRIHRRIIESEIFASEKGLKIWIWILTKANYKKRFIPIRIGAGQTTVELERSELIFGRFSAEEELGIDGSTIYKWLKKMELLKMIELKSNSHYTVIKVSNYNEYNDIKDYESSSQVTTEEQPSSSTVTTEEQHGNTPKKEKKVNKVKKEEYPPNVSEIFEYSKPYFEEKYINNKWKDCIDKLIRIDNYTPEEIKEVIAWARSDSFWSTNFISPLKLRDKDKNDVKYIDKFKLQKNGKQRSTQGSIDQRRNADKKTNYTTDW